MQKVWEEEAVALSIYWISYVVGIQSKSLLQDKYGWS